MNKHLQEILNIIQQSQHLSDAEKTALSEAAKSADKDLMITAFKLDRTEKVKRTTSILLEETIEELENKRKAVEAQNHELEIETALERVRTVAMSMKEPADMLEICRTISNQLEALHVKEIRNVQTAIFYESKGTYMNYEYYAKHDKTFITETSFTNHKMHQAFAEQMLKGSGEFFVTTIPKEELSDWIAYQKTTNVFIDAFLETASSLSYYWFSLGPVALGISTYKPLQEEETNLFKRFLKVFQLSYTRYLDIETAEAQARENQIQLALERVRARTMAMQKSDELSDAVYVLFQQFKELGENPDQATIGVINEDENVIEYWVTMYGQPINKVFKFSIDEPNVTNKIYHAWKENKKSLVIDLSGNALTEFMTYRANKGGAAVNENEKRRIINVAFFSKGLLNVQSNEERSEESIKLLERFASVFEQTYTRFLDLQTAEAQARESQIQLALERVRARTMAMQKSDELSETAAILFSQFKNLGYKPDRITIGIMQEDKHILDLWATNGETGEPRQFYQLPFNEPHVLSKCVKAWKDQKKSLVLDISGEPLKEYTNFWKSFVPTPDARSTIDRVVFNFAFFSKGYLGFISFEQVPQQTIELLERFAGVFDLTYTRFLDLKKAEAQAREAQIEAALERVRSRSLAMHKSTELKEVIRVVLQQFAHLNINAEHAGFYIDYKTQDEMHIWLADPNIEPFFAIIPYFDTSTWNSFLEAKTKGTAFHTDLLDFEEKNKFYESLFKLFTVPEEAKEFYMQCKGLAVSTVLLDNVGLYIENFSAIPYTDEENKILMRFGKVFQQTYTRFLDLQKAEEQAREGQIQLALERVRARTMAMQKQNDLLGVLDLLVQQLIKLNVHFEIANFSNGIPDADWDLWIDVITSNGELYSNYVHFPRIDHPYFHRVEKNIEVFRNGGGDLFKDVFSKDEKDSWQDYICTQTIYKDLVTLEDKEYIYSKPGYTWSMVLLKDTWVSICRFDNIPFSDEEDALFRRFANAFGQAYTRFLDLQKAEAQAREAQIEAALERVRSRTMAMHKSSELTQTAEILFDQLRQLGAELQGVAFAICDENSIMVQKWTSIGIFSHPYNIEPGEQRMYEAWKNQSGIYEEVYEGERQKKYYEAFMQIPEFRQGIQKFIDAGYPLPTWQKNHAVTFKYGYLLFITTKPFNETQIFLRFGKVFEQTYTRFLDLQKAEAQARDAQIEAALERVRSRSIAMRKSEEIADIAGKIFSELRQLDLLLNRVLIWIFNDTEKYMTWWSSNPEVESTAESYRLDYNENPVFINYLQAWQQRKPIHLFTLSGNTKKNWEDHLFEHTEMCRLPIEVREGMRSEHIIYTVSVISDYGLMMSGSSEPLSEASIDIIQRFGRVFQQSYTRYLDVQKAEAQAREAQIEAALERVRAKAMAMQNSNDLSIAASMVFTELRKLGISPIRCGVGLLSKETRKAQLYSATSSDDGDSLALVGWVMLSDHPVLKSIYNAWEKHEDYFPQLTGEQLKLYYEKLLAGLSLPSVPNWQKGEKQYGHFFSFSIGCLYAWSETSYNESEIKILKRFATIVDLTFRRYLELQTSEANAREAIKQAALDRIRADIASMRTVSDLDRITPLIWNELTILGIPFIRCGVFIMDDEQQLIHTFLSTPDGKAIAAFHIPYDTQGNIKHVISHWHQKKNYIDHWDGDAFTIFAKTLVTQGALTSSKQYLKTIPHGGFYLHFIPFLQGMLYVGNTTQLSEDEINLIQSLADAFSTAYARYEDFNKLEAAKKQVDKTLIELKQTQQQLVQSEKMASLGELTAGIAHEIQNPLNFVNNFSEVSKELIDEMRTALENGDKEEAEQIANDIIQNLEKINHHGKRADAIVKNMLQHSRKNSGQKELTDIHALCDEYLRLSFHGMRAKDKSFNADFKTDFDESIGKINIVPQDIGRVLLNLFNNAFYAVNEKKKLGVSSYEPRVIVQTKKLSDKIEIKISDNGNGIPDLIKEKIFQPFFTTKPTGQGTGLGLSLSYDIIKAHGGEIEVETKAEEGSSFIITLSI